ncbi:MAG: SIMPL domain-containing protein [Candidatus Roizmanbacteria bacterium]|nr:SIMPL domain-containing protein [Candidatus Roizmanbacteria bacterium]
MNTKILTTIAAGAVVVLVAVFIAPWWLINWGTLSLREGKTVTVIGTAESNISNQIATFNVGFNAVNENKEEAVMTVDEAMTQIIEEVKAFGIPEEDIQTSGNSIYQEEEPITLEGRQTSQPGRWRVSNNITITLRDITRVQELNDILSSSGANNVWGPNFTVDETSEADNELLGKAIENAREKAAVLAEASGKQVGSVLSISEAGSSAGPFLLRTDEMGGGGGAPIEPGTQTVSKSITVTFELR